MNKLQVILSAHVEIVKRRIQDLADLKLDLVLGNITEERLQKAKMSELAMMVRALKDAAGLQEPSKIESFTAITQKYVMDKPEAGPDAYRIIESPTDNASSDNSQRHENPPINTDDNPQTT